VADAVGLAWRTASVSTTTRMDEIMLETAGAVGRTISGSPDLAETFRRILR